VGLAADAFEIGKIAGFANQQAKIGARVGQSFRHMVAHKAGCACKENFHRRILGELSFYMLRLLGFPQEWKRRARPVHSKSKNNRRSFLFGWRKSAPNSDQDDKFIAMNQRFASLAAVADSVWDWDQARLVSNVRVIFTLCTE
jgi:hypothetical protein